MEFHGLHRRTLQSLCKKNNIPANLTNAAMAEALTSLPTVIGADEAKEQALRTPTSKPVSLRPPNPPRSCRRSSVLPLLKEEGFPKEDKDFPASPSSSGVKRRRAGGAVLFPCGEQQVTDEMPVRKEVCEGPELAVLVLEEMRERNRDAGRKKDVKEEEAGGDCLDAVESRNVDFCVRAEESEDKDSALMKYTKQGEENLVSVSGKSDLISASGGCLDEAVRLLSSQESVNTAKGQESTLLQSPSLGGLVPVEQEQGSKDDGEHQVSKGGMEERSLNSAESESEEILASEERHDDMDCEMMNDLGSVDGGHQVLRGEVEDQRLNSVDFESEEMLSSRDRSEHMDILKSGEQDQGVKDDGVHQVSGEEVEVRSLNNTAFESGEISQDMDAETIKDNRAIQMGASDFENHVGEVRLPANGDRISPFDSDAKNPTLANAVCAIPLAKDQECGSPQEVLGAEIEQGLQNTLTETYEDAEAENRRNIEIQVHNIPLDSKANEDSICLRTDSILTIGENSCVIPDREKAANSIHPIPVIVGYEIGMAESNSGVKGPILDEGEGEKREFVESTDSGKGEKEVTKVEMVAEKQGVNKADLSSLSLRKLKALYKQNKRVGKLEMENMAEGTKAKDELEERSAEKTRLNGLSLRQLKQMYKHKVANISI